MPKAPLESLHTPDADSQTTSKTLDLSAQVDFDALVGADSGMWIECPPIDKATAWLISLQ